MNRTVKDFFLQNIWLKLLSVGIAILAWCTIMNMSDPNITVTLRNISVNKINEQSVVDENMIYDVVSGDTISITVTGPRSVLQQLTKDDVNAYIDLKELSITNACPIHISFKNASVANKVEVTSKSDEVMVLSLEEMVTENKQVAVVLSGAAAEGYYAISSVSPLLIEVYGSETQVSKVERLVANVNIDGQNTSFIKTVEVIPYDKDNNVLDATQFTLKDNKVSVSVELLPTKNINVVVDADVSAEYGFACMPLEQAPTSITIAGPPDIISNITEITIPYKAENLKETVAENISLTEYIPEGCHLVSNIDSVSVTIPVVMLDESREMTVNVSNIAMRNLPSGFSTVNKTSSVHIRVWGAEGTTGNLTVSSLGLYADCSSVKAPGSYQLKINCDNGGNYIIDDVSANIVFSAP